MVSTTGRRREGGSGGACRLSYRRLLECCRHPVSAKKQRAFSLQARKDETGRRIHDGNPIGLDGIWSTVQPVYTCFFLEPIWFPQLGGGGREVLEGGSRRRPRFVASVCSNRLVEQAHLGVHRGSVAHPQGFLVHTLESTSCCIDSDTSMRYCIDTAVSASIEAPAERVKYAASSAGVLQEFCARYTHPCQLLNTHR